MAEGEFKVRSLGAIDTINQDGDVGVIRVAAARLEELGGRNALVRVSTMKDGRRVKSLVRIVRDKNTLKENEIAIQYDDRRALGIYRVGKLQSISIEKVKAWQLLSCLRFLLFHTSPLIRYQTSFAIAVAIASVAAAYFLGFLGPSGD